MILPSNCERSSCQRQRWLLFRSVLVGHIFIHHRLRVYHPTRGSCRHVIVVVVLTAVSPRVLRRFTAPRETATSPPITAFPRRPRCIKVLGFFHEQVDFFDNEFALLVLLRGFVGALIGPPHDRLAALTMQIADRVQARHEQAIFRWSECCIDGTIQQVGPASAALK